jgi:hypothetical protein
MHAFDVSSPPRRVLEEIRKGPEGYRGQISLVRQYLRQIRPRRKRVYQEVFYDPAQAMQVDGGNYGRVKIGSTSLTIGAKRSDQGPRDVKLNDAIGAAAG